jgi:phosphoribosyl 1,2-cyclic phosphate phosphodiesterase
VAGSGLLNLKVTVLGSGTSHGVPMIGCDCAVCHSDDPRDRRSRPSILIELRAAAAPGVSAFASDVRSILVDTSTDLRAQALAHGLRRVDAILFTHSHADHILGLDEVRRFNIMKKGAIPFFADAATLLDLRQTFSYIFATRRGPGGGIPELVPFRIGGPFSLGGVEIVPVPLLHGKRLILGFRLGPFAYLTDCSAIPESSWALLAGVQVVILDALRHKPHPTHFTVEQALDALARLQPRQAYLTHICHDLPHAATCAALPAGVELAYDGLTLEL